MTPNMDMKNKLMCVLLSRKCICIQIEIYIDINNDESLKNLWKH
jgi:hypothetical protein